MAPLQYVDKHRTEIGTLVQHYLHTTTPYNYSILHQMGAFLLFSQGKILEKSFYFFLKGTLSKHSLHKLLTDSNMQACFPVSVSPIPTTFCI